jgi:hypothetical protein
VPQPLKATSALPTNVANCKPPFNWAFKVNGALVLAALLPSLPFLSVLLCLLQLRCWPQSAGSGISGWWLGWQLGCQLCVLPLLVPMRMPNWKRSPCFIIFFPGGGSSSCNSWKDLLEASYSLHWSLGLSSSL